MKELELRVCQADALEHLRLHRENGADKALIVMASSLGKTITAIYDIESFMKNRPDGGRALILCHINSILNGLRKAFEDVLGNDYTYGTFSGVDKCLEKTDFLFATFQSVRLYMNEFEPKEFAYIVVDECHHAKANTFEEVIQHFEPEFLLGITATSVRTDGKQIGDIFGDAVHEVDLIEAISSGLVAAIDYRLMLDDILAIKNFVSEDNQKITLAELNKRIFVPKRDEEIVSLINEKTAERKNPKTIIFCSTIEHAERMANLIPNSTIVHSKIGTQENLDRIEGFKDGRYSTIVSVDMLNEGVDIPGADVIVFLRSTVSPIVYYQQLGRGLRLHENKDNVLVLDFVANCERIEMIESFKNKVIERMKKSNTYKPHKRLKRFNVNIDRPEFAEIEVDILSKIKQARANQAKTGHVWTKEEVILSFQRFYKENSRVPKVEDCKKCDYLPNYGTIEKLFESYNDAIIAAGLEPTIKKWNKESADKALLKFATAWRGGRVSIEDIKKCSNLPDPCTLRKIYGADLYDILKMFGLNGYDQHKWTKDEVVLGLKQYYETYKKVPTGSDIDNCEFLPSNVTVRKLFGSLNEMYILAGIPVPRRYDWTKEEILSNYNILCRELGHFANKKEVTKCPYLPCPNTIAKIFGLWAHFVEVATGDKETFKKK